MRAIEINQAEKNYKRIEYGLVFLFFFWLIWGIFSKDKMPAVDGLGWDGVSYANIAREFPQWVLHNLLSEYRLQRILPSGIIYFFTKIAHVSLSVSRMPMAFSIYNTVLLGFSVFIWRAIATRLQWRPEVRLVSFAGLFLNYAILKMNTYYPVLTDTSAFFCGLLMLYFFIAGKNYFVLLTSIISAFVFPTLLYVGLILFVFPREKVKNPVSESSFFSRDGLFFAALIAAFVVMLSLVFNYRMEHKEGFALGAIFSMPVLFFSATALFGYLFLALCPLYVNYVKVLNQIKTASWFRVMIACFVFVFIKSVIHSFSSGEAGPLTPRLFLHVITIRAIAYPFIFLISDVLYYGPVVCLLIYFWKEVAGWLKNNNFTLLIITAFYVILSIDSEARQVINFLPIAVFAVAEVLNQQKLSARFTYGFIILSLLISRFWLPLNHGEWPSLFTNPPQVTLEFPMQWYFMSQAPWMSHAMYVVASITVMMVFLAVYSLLKREVRPDTALSQDFSRA
ncbi:MAG TPA: hypothetical protein VLJ15_06310 [Gammaproteobacteria bacterium]|nr:hypothetical protein [Gammaproteobacteria bacterium]